MEDSIAVHWDGPEDEDWEQGVERKLETLRHDIGELKALKELVAKQGKELKALRSDVRDLDHYVAALQQQVGSSPASAKRTCFQ